MGPGPEQPARDPMATGTRSGLPSGAMRHLLSYLLFVGVPLAGLLGVLRYGQRLPAPAAVHGAYAVQPMAATGRACQSYLLGGKDSSLMVLQSGRQLTLRLGPASDVTLDGTLSGSELTLMGVIEPGSTPRFAACSVGDTLRLTAHLTRAAQVKRLDAILSSSACPECTPITFVAERPRRYEGRRRS